MAALLVGSIYASHHFFIPRFIDTQTEVYYPITGADYFDEVLLYSPRAHSVFLDFGIRGDFSLAEYPQSPALLPMLNPLLLGGLGKIVGSFEGGIIASDFLFPAIIFFILYLFFREIAGGIYGPLLFSMLFVFSPKFGISFPPISNTHFFTLAQTVAPFLRMDDPLYFSHFEEPKLTFVFFAFCLYAISRALVRRGRGNIILAGISFGILFYTYLYDWALMLTSLGMMGSYFLIQRDYGRLKIIACIAGIGFFVSLYYWINLIKLKGLVQSKDVIARLGGEFSHRFRFDTVWKSYGRALALSGILWIVLRKKTPSVAIVLGAFLMSYIVVVNAQVITGFNVQPDHWYRGQFLPIAASIGLMCVWLYRRFMPVNIRKYVPMACMVFIFYFFAAALYGQYAYSRDRADLFAIPIAYQEGFDWLNAHAEEASVVGTLSFKGNLDLQMHTPYFIFNPFGLSTVASEEELWNRFMIMAWIRGVDGTQFASLINKEGGAYYLFGDQYGIHTFDAAFSTSSWHVPDEVLKEKTALYEKMLTEKNNSLSDYRLDYLFVNRKEFPEWKEPRDMIPAPIKVFDNGRVAIYAF